MGTIERMAERDERLFPAEEQYTNARTVQGAVLSACGNVKHVKSPKRFKIYSNGTLLLRITEGGGFIKWARGEFPFAAGDLLRLKHTGEAELNGACAFYYIQED